MGGGAPMPETGAGFGWPGEVMMSVRSIGPGLAGIPDRQWGKKRPATSVRGAGRSAELRSTLVRSAEVEVPTEALVAIPAAIEHSLVEQCGETPTDRIGRATEPVRLLDLQGRDWLSTYEVSGLFQGRLTILRHGLDSGKSKMT